MAYNRRYESTYFSLNGRQYYLEIRDSKFTGTTRDCDLGAGGCQIHYDMDGEEKYSPIIASKMDIPFIVKDAIDEQFIKNLLEDYNEEDVVVALYRGGSPGYSPLWSGYLLMDLGAQQDVSFPYEVKLTATDGLGRLKDIGFWNDESAQQTYKHKGHQRVIYWLGQIINKINPPGTSEGISSDAKMTAAVNWYNELHQSASTSFGPLYQTKIKMGMMENVDSSDTITVRNCYDVLTNICTTFGMRCIYWKHKFWFIQLDGYNTNESGTVTNPQNINTRTYTLADPPVHSASNDYLGSTWWSRYNQTIENQLTPGRGIQKLAGTTYENFPILKQVSADFMNAGDENYYNGFPESTPGATDTGGVGNTVTVAQTIMDDPQSATNLMLRVPLNFQQDTSVGSWNNNLYMFKVKFYFYIKASIPTGATGTGSTKYLQRSGGSYSWGSIAPQWSTTLPYFETDFMTANSAGKVTLIPFGTQNGELPPLTGVTGTWQLEIILQAYQDINPFNPGVWQDPVTISNIGGGTVANGIDYAIHGVKWSNALNMASGNWINQVVTNQNGVSSNTLTFVGTGSPYAGQLFLLNSSLSLGTAGTKIVTETNESDTSQLFLGQLNWGDSPLDSDPSSIQVYNGSAWVFTDPSGDWGIGTITPSSPLSLTKLLLKEYLDGQSIHIYKMNAQITVGAHDKNITDASGQRPKYINPIGRLVDPNGAYPSKNYIFLRGTFATGDDTWDGEWFNINRGTPTLSTTSTDITGLNTPASSAVLPSYGQGSNASAKMLPPSTIGVTTAGLSAASIVTNGQFSTDSDWTKGSGVTIASDKLTFTSVASGVGATNTATITVGKQYEVKFKVSGFSSGGCYVKLGATAGTTVTANGDYTQSITPESTTAIAILSSAAGTTLDVEGITIVEKITSIPIVDFGETILADNDRFTLVDSQNGNEYDLRLNAAQTSGDTALTIDAYAFSEDVGVPAFITVNQKNLIQQYQNKTEGSIGGDTIIVGVDTDYIKLVPRDFISNDDVANKEWAFDDTGTTGVRIFNASTELWAFVPIPYGKKATHIAVWGNNTKNVEAYELNVNASGIGSTLGTGTVGTEFSITNLSSDATNYLGVKVITTGTSNRIYGGKVTLANI